MVDANIVVAVIGSFSAIAGSLVTTLANHLNEKSKSERADKAHLREKEQKWLDDRRSAYIKFILAFSKPLSSSDIQDDLLNLTEAASEAYLYGDITLPEPFISKNPMSILDHCLSNTKRKEVIDITLDNFSEFQINNDWSEIDREINSLFSLVVELSNLRGLSPLYKSSIEQKSEGGDKLGERIRTFSDLMRIKALDTFMPVFLYTIEKG